MPLLVVEIVGDPDAADRGALAQRIADAAARVFDSPPQSTWVRVRIVAPGDYAENEGAEHGVRPVFVSVLKRSVPPGGALQAEVARLTAAIAAACRLPAENVHICYEPPGAGRQAFGGKLVEE